jgi:hypothetical protein
MAVLAFSTDLLAPTAVGSAVDPGSDATVGMAVSGVADTLLELAVAMSDLTTVTDAGSATMHRRYATSTPSVAPAARHIMTAWLRPSRCRRPTPHQGSATMYPVSLLVESIQQGHGVSESSGSAWVDRLPIRQPSRRCSTITAATTDGGTDHRPTAANNHRTDRRGTTDPIFVPEREDRVRGATLVNAAAVAISASRRAHGNLATHLLILGQLRFCLDIA